MVDGLVFFVFSAAFVKISLPLVLFHVLENCQFSPFESAIKLSEAEQFSS
jgi:hypothetical protein